MGYTLWGNAAADGAEHSGRQQASQSSKSDTIQITQTRHDLQGHAYLGFSLSLNLNIPVRPTCMLDFWQVPETLHTE